MIFVLIQRHKRRHLKSATSSWPDKGKLSWDGKRLLVHVETIQLLLGVTDISSYLSPAGTQSNVGGHVSEFLHCLHFSRIDIYCLLRRCEDLSSVDKFQVLLSAKHLRWNPWIGVDQPNSYALLIIKIIVCLRWQISSSSSCAGASFTSVPFVFGTKFLRITFLGWHPNCQSSAILTIGQ